MKEKFKEWLLRKLVTDLLSRGYFVHLFMVITEEHLNHFNEDNLYATRQHLHKLVDMAANRVAAQGDPLL